MGVVGDPPRPGALVVSLDFELHWGMRDRRPPVGSLESELRASRRSVTDLAALFEERGVRATWATVGLLFATTRAEAERHMPARRPRYRRPELDPYQELIGADEGQDPLHLAGSLVSALAAMPGQEVASHTFSHYYCLEEGQDGETFEADLAAARAIAAARGIVLRSLVLPRNQWHPPYAPVLLRQGFTCYRGPQPGWAHRGRRDEDGSALVRAARMADTYGGIRPPPTFAWGELDDGTGLCNIPGSAFLRPWTPVRRRLEPLRRARLVAGLRDAARHGRILHLWWHPHNVTAHPQPHADLLHRLFDEADRLASSTGFRCLTMAEVAAEASHHDCRTT